MEPLPVVLIITLISAAILRRKAPVEPAAGRAVMFHITCKKDEGGHLAMTTLVLESWSVLGTRG